jgi:hypothetical protein
MTARCITKQVSIQAPVANVFAFLADAGNWPKWAIVNVLSIAKADADWWTMQTPAGPARLRLRPNPGLGILDHDFHAGDARWTVPARVVPNGDGSEFLITFFKPPTFTDDFFVSQLALVDKELAKLKQLMEAPR